MVSWNLVTLVCLATLHFIHLTNSQEDRWWITDRLPICGKRDKFFTCRSEAQTLSLNCDTWHKWRRCMDDIGCTHSKVEAIKRQVLIKKDLDCGTGSLTSYLGVIISALLFLHMW